MEFVACTAPLTRDWEGRWTARMNTKRVKDFGECAKPIKIGKGKADGTEPTNNKKDDERDTMHVDASGGGASSAASSGGGASGGGASSARRRPASEAGGALKRQVKTAVPPEGTRRLNAGGGSCLFEAYEQRLMQIFEKQKGKSKKFNHGRLRNMMVVHMKRHEDWYKQSCDWKSADGSGAELMIQQGEKANPNFGKAEHMDEPEKLPKLRKPTWEE